MIGAAPLEITSCHKRLDTAPNRWGSLRRSDDIKDNPAEMVRRVDEDGYLYVPGFFELGEVMEARLSVLKVLQQEGALDPSADWRDALAKPDLEMAFRPDLANGNPEIAKLLYSPKVMGFYDHLLGGSSTHYDYTWLRAVAPGRYTEPHYDIVYMGRGSKRIFTAWVPMSDIPYEVGGLMILENSHRLEDLKATYGAMDVDELCENKDSKMVMADQGFHGFGALTDDPVQLAEQLDRRWLTAEFKMGDLLTFTMYTLHASTDNRSSVIRLSTDSRYQLASEPMDERWIGEHPIAHGPNAKRNMIC